MRVSRGLGVFNKKSNAEPFQACFEYTLAWLATHTYYSYGNFGLWGLSHIHKVWEKLLCASFQNFLPLFWSRISIANARNLSTKSLIIIVLVFGEYYLFCTLCKKIDFSPISCKKSTVLHSKWTLTFRVMVLDNKWI